jgi:hypothetical protein
MLSPITEDTMQGMKPIRSAAGSARVVLMVVVVVILIGANAVLDFYVAGQQLASIVEGRGGALVDALARFKRETGNLPDALDKLAPKYLLVVPKCPNGQPFAYAQAGTEFELVCQDIVFKSKPYRYDSKSRAWSG